MKKLSALVRLLGLLFPAFAHAQGGTSYGRIQTDRIANKAVIITGPTRDVSNGNVFKTSNALPATITRVQEPIRMPLGHARARSSSTREAALWAAIADTGIAGRFRAGLSTGSHFSLELDL